MVYTNYTKKASESHEYICDSAIYYIFNHWPYTVLGQVWPVSSGIYPVRLKVSLISKLETTQHLAKGQRKMIWRM